MATRIGSFGHRRAAGGNLTALIASLLQQQHAAEDRVMFDAYANGGRGLDGKPVTDATMRKYVAGRRNGFDHADPLWSEWNNRLIQLDFKIGEEKVQLAYKQGHVGAGAVAAFYSHQLRNIPRNSEFYRDVAGRAAQWARAGASAARGRARSRVSAQLDGKERTALIQQQSFSVLDAIVTDAAKRAGLIAGNETVTDADATDLEALLQHGIPYGKQTITFDMYRKAALTAYKSFDAQIAIKKAKGNTYKTLLKDKMKFLNQTLVRLNTLDDRAKYEEARDAFQKAAAGETDPRKILELTQEYAKTLASIRDKALVNEKNLATLRDPEFIGGLNNEITAIATGKVTGPTVTDLQHTTGEGVTTSDAEETVKSLYGEDGKGGALNDVQALHDGTAYYGQEKYGGKFKVIEKPPAGPLDPTGRGGLGEDMQPAVLNIDGVPTQVMLKGQPVISVALKDPQGAPVTDVVIDGQPVPVEQLTGQEIAQLKTEGYDIAQGESPVGYVFNAAGKTTYGVKQDDGSIVFTDTNPFNVATTTDNGTLVVAVEGQSNAAGDVVPTPLKVNPDAMDSAAPLISDTTVSPRDLMALANASANPQQQQALIALANKREQDIYASRHFEPYQNHGQDTRGQAILDTFRGALDTVAGLFGPREQQPGANAPSVPYLPKIGNQTPQTFSPPSLTPTPSGLPKANPAVGPGPTGPLPANNLGGYLGAQPNGGVPKLPSTQTGNGNPGGVIGGANDQVVRNVIRRRRDAEQAGGTQRPQTPGGTRAPIGF